MASVEKRLNGKWRARYRDQDGKQHARHFDRKVDASNWLDTIRGDLQRGTYVDPSAGKRTFGEFADAWLDANVSHKKSTELQVRGNFKNHVAPRFGKRELASIRPSEVQAWVKHLSDDLAPGTVELIYRYVASVFKAAVNDRMIVSSPCVGVKLPKREKTRVEPLAKEVIDAMIVNIDDRYRAMIVMAAGTGLRQGELFGVTVDRVDFLRRTVRVDRQIALLPGGPVFTPPKTDKSNRTVPLPNVVVTALAEHLAKYPAGESGLIFTDNGEPIRRNRFNERIWRPALKALRSQLPTGPHFHDLRHFYASLLIRHGESVKVVQERLGHASATETLDTYSHLWPDSDDQTRAAVDSVFGEQQSSNSPQEVENSREMLRTVE